MTICFLEGRNIISVAFATQGLIGQLHDLVMKGPCYWLKINFRANGRFISHLDQCNNISVRSSASKDLICDELVSYCVVGGARTRTMTLNISFIHGATLIYHKNSMASDLLYIFMYSSLGDLVLLLFRCI